MIIKMALVLVRLFTIYYFMSILYYVPAMIMNVTSDASIDMHSLSVMWQFLICFLLFFFPRAVLIGLRFPKGETDAGDACNARIFQSAGVELIGLGFAMYGLQGLVNIQFLQWMTSEYNLGTSVLSPHEIASFWTSVFEVVGGILLIAASDGISGLITWLRELRPAVDAVREEKLDN